MNILRSLSQVREIIYISKLVSKQLCIEATGYRRDIAPSTLAEIWNDKVVSHLNLVRAVFTWLSQNQNQSKYTSQPKGVVKSKPKPKPIPLDSQVKTALTSIEVVIRKAYN